MRGRPVSRPLAALLLAAAASVSVANDATPLAADPALEARVKQVAEELRCLVCQNETLAASQAPLAVDLRGQIRAKLQQGDTPEQVLGFMVERFGPFVRYRPAFDATTALLWVGPFAMLGLGAVGLARHVRHRRADAPQADLSDAERRRLAQLLGAEPSRR